MSQEERKLFMRNKLINRCRRDNCAPKNISKPLNDQISSNEESKLIKHPAKSSDNILNNTGEDLRNPFAANCIIPLPGTTPETWVRVSGEPSLIRKRNERERERVRCVNEGYARLRRHLPLSVKDRRISKVETLRYAIAYIEYLQELIQFADAIQQNCVEDATHYFREHSFPHPSN